MRSCRCQGTKKRFQGSVPAVPGRPTTVLFLRYRREWRQVLGCYVLCVVGRSHGEDVADDRTGRGTWSSIGTVDCVQYELNCGLRRSVVLTNGFSGSSFVFSSSACWAGCCSADTKRFNRTKTKESQTKMRWVLKVNHCSLFVQCFEKPCCREVETGWVGKNCSF